jgi:hypothetical protein
MPTTTEATPAFAELAALEAEVLAAEARVRDVQVAMGRSRRELHATRAELRDLYAAAEAAGKPAPAAKVKDLTEQIAAHQARMEQRDVPNPLGGPGATRTELVDLAVEARLDAAQAAVEDARGAVVEFVRAERDRLQAELTERALTAGEDLLAAVDGLAAAHAAWIAVRRQWIEMGSKWGIAPSEIPNAPLPGDALQKIDLVAAQVRGGARDPRGAIPMPARLAPGRDLERQRADTDGLEVRDHNPLRGWEPRQPDVVSYEGHGVLPDGSWEARG